MSSLDPSLNVYRGTGGNVGPLDGAGGELRPTPGRLDRVVRRIAGMDAPPPAREPFESKTAFLVDLALELVHELRTAVAVLREIRDVESGDLIAKPVRVVIDANRPFYTFSVDAPQAFHSIKVDNPSAVPVELRFDGSQPTAGNSDERVPAHMGRMLTRAYDECSVGIDPAAIPGGQTPVYVTFYSRALPPASWAFV